MARYLEIEETDLNYLLSALEHARVKTAPLDLTLSKYLEEVLNRVAGHLENERQGCREATEIDIVLGFLSPTESDTIPDTDSTPALPRRHRGPRLKDSEP